MTELIPVAQAIAGLLWLFEAAVLTPGAWRVWRGRGDALDAGRIPIVVIALLQAGFSARWFIWPHAIRMMATGEMAFWATLYFASAATAVFCISAHRAVGRSLR